MFVQRKLSALRPIPSLEDQATGRPSYTPVYWTLRFAGLRFKHCNTPPAYVDVQSCGQLKLNIRN
jgi:hypothetical protein